MRNVEISLPIAAGDDQVEQAVERAIAKLGLVVTLRDTLKAFPGSIHWHVKNGAEAGTLEITFWPAEHRAWFTVQSGREAPWTSTMMTLLRKKIEGKLS